MRLTKRIKKKFYIPDDPDDGWVELKHLKMNEVKKIEAKVNEITYSSKRGEDDGETKIALNPYTRVRQFAIAALTDWGNMFDVMGKPMSLNEVNINKAAEFEITVDGEKFDFFSWIDKCRDDLAAEVDVETEKAEEN
jgi:hypothetical protein